MAGARVQMAKRAVPAQADVLLEVEEQEVVPADRPTVARVGFAPVVRVDGARREVELCATSEAVDAHGTVFDYAASKDAFTRWVGNVREMHERRAVGQRVRVRCDDETRQIYVRIRISRGAEDTWEKLVDGTLRGASIGASNVQWERQRRRAPGGERWVRVATRYDLVELSLVDNPSNPDAMGLSFVRDAVPDASLLDRLDRIASDETDADDRDTAEEGQTDAAQRQYDSCVPLRPAGELATLWERAAGEPEREPVVEGVAAVEAAGSIETRAGGPATVQAEVARATGDTARDRLHLAARTILEGCECVLCAAALAGLGGSAVEGEARRGVAAGAGPRDEARETALGRTFAAGLHASTARLDQVDASVRGLRAVVQAAVNQSTLTMEELRLRVQLLEAQPAPGGPAARAAEKALALAPVSRGQAVADAGEQVREQYRVLESLAGRLSDPQVQVAVAAEMIRLQRQG